MRRADLEADRRYCRAILPRVSRTFAINIRLLHGDLGEAVRVGYLLCRTADALEDSWPGGPEAIVQRFEDLAAAVNGSEEAAESLASAAMPIARGRFDLELVTNLPRVLRVFRSLPPESREVLAEALGVMAAGMSRYASRAARRGTGVSYLDNEGELHDYCFTVAGCVGVMLTRLASARASAPPDVLQRRLELAPQVGEALQLTNILLDWPRDTRRGRCHVPSEWLAEWHLAPADLVGDPKPGVRELASRVESLARRALEGVPTYVSLFPARFVSYRMFSLWPALWAAASLGHARRDRDFPWGDRRPRLPRPALWRLALEALLFGHGAQGVNLLCERALGDVPASA